MGNVQFSVSPQSETAAQGDTVLYTMSVRNSTWSNVSVNVNGSIPSGLGELVSFDPSVIINGNKFHYTTNLSGNSSSIHSLKIHIGDNAPAGNYTINFDTDQTSGDTANLEVIA